ncbi:MAG: alpha/beta hydrolase [Clostridia bacterium]|nr:alpha/beta hydrolase [Clostridia bacterium]
MNTCIDLKKHYSVAGGKLICYTIECPTGNEKEWRRPAVIVVPGGAYEHVSKREGAPVACQFLARGFQAFVLEYLTVHDNVHYPEQLHELASAVDYLKTHSEEFHINKDEIFVVGFSEGGHLTANLAVDYLNLSNVGKKLDCKPTAVALGYPVISTEFGHTRSHANLLFGFADAEKQALLNRLNLDKAVTKKTVPAFIWTTAEDSTVPAINSLKFASALAENGVKYELHVYPETDHGSSTCDFEVNCERVAYRKNAQWLQNCAEFFRLFTVEKY